MAKALLILVTLLLVAGIQEAMSTAAATSEKISHGGMRSDERPIKPGTPKVLKRSGVKAHGSLSTQSMEASKVSGQEKVKENTGAMTKEYARTCKGIESECTRAFLTQPHFPNVEEYDELKTGKKPVKPSTPKVRPGIKDGLRIDERRVKSGTPKVLKRPGIEEHEELSTQSMGASKVPGQEKVKENTGAMTKEYARTCKGIESECARAFLTQPHFPNVKEHDEVRADERPVKPDMPKVLKHSGVQEDGGLRNDERPIKSDTPKALKRPGVEEYDEQIAPSVGASKVPGQKKVKENTGAMTKEYARTCKGMESECARAFLTQPHFSNTN